jgi:hypothetical protein
MRVGVTFPILIKELVYVESSGLKDESFRHTIHNFITLTPKGLGNNFIKYVKYFIKEGLGVILILTTK